MADILRTDRARTAVAGGAGLLLLLFIGRVLWYQDWRYSLPTPRPPELVQPPLGALLGSPWRQDGRPTMLHFFNPACPCSRFNLDHQRRHRRFLRGLLHAASRAARPRRASLLPRQL